MEIIAEIGQAHEGSIGIAHSYIDALAETGVDVIKFQTHFADAESSHAEPFRVKFSYEDKTRFDYWKRMEFTKNQWIELKKHCEDKGVEFMSSPFSIKAAKLLNEIEVKRFKIGSGEVNNFLLIDYLSKLNKPLLVSSGMSSFKELDQTVSFLKDKNVKFSLLQCTTSYPCKSGEWGLSLIPKLRDKYDVPIGFSDHSGDIYAPLAAAALGAELIEFHVVFDNRMFGPDSKSSINISQVEVLVKGVRQIKNDLIKYKNYKIDNSKFSELKNTFEKSLAVNKDLKKDHVITFDDLEAKKPANKGINTKFYKKIIGESIKYDISKGSFLTEKHFKSNLL